MTSPFLLAYSMIMLSAADAGRSYQWTLSDPALARKSTQSGLGFISIKSFKQPEVEFQSLRRAKRHRREPDQCHPLPVRVCCQNLHVRVARSNQSDDRSHGHAQPTHGRFATHYVRVSRYSVQHHKCSLDFTLLGALSIQSRRRSVNPKTFNEALFQQPGIPVTDCYSPPFALARTTCAHFNRYKERFERLACYKFGSTGHSLPGF